MKYGYLLFGHIFGVAFNLRLKRELRASGQGVWVSQTPWSGDMGNWKQMRLKNKIIINKIIQKNYNYIGKTKEASNIIYHHQWIQLLPLNKRC